MDACALVEETEKDIRKLRKKRRTVIQTNVKGSNPEFPFNEQHFKIQGTPFTYNDDKQLRCEELILKERKTNAAKIKAQAEAVINTAPIRIQRIIRYKIILKLSWEEISIKMGEGKSGDAYRKQFESFLKEK